jgi:hypothetical protein
MQRPKTPAGPPVPTGPRAAARMTRDKLVAQWLRKLAKGDPKVGTTNKDGKMCQT